MGVDCTGQHQCEPDWYPTELSQEWTCPECGREHHAFRVDEADWLPATVKGRLIPGTLGWTSDR